VQCLCAGLVFEGVPLVDGGTVRLPQLIGLSRALDMILTGRPVKANEAFNMGLANRVVQTGSGTVHCFLWNIVISYIIMLFYNLK